MEYMGKITKIQLVIGALIAIGVVLLAVIVFGFIRFNKINKEINALSGHVAVLETNFSSTTAELRGNISESHTALADALEQEKQNVGNIEQNLKKQVSSVSGTVNTLQKLSKTDPELLAKYSKVFFLNENYAPPRLVEIPSTYRYSDAKILKIHEAVWPFLQEMIDEAKDEKVQLYAFSAYRSFNEQQALKGQYTVTYGAGTANTFSADQGYSEHQLGTTLDFIAPGQGGIIDGFDKTASYQWMLKNAYKYGFILSYPAGNTFYQYEPWHWRFVGVKLATDLHKEGKNFYDLDQREIDEYLVNIFD